MKFFPCSLLLNDFALNLGFLVYRMEIPPTLKSSHRHSVAAIVTETSLIRKDVILSNVHYLPPRNPSDKECTMLLHQHQPRHDPLQIPQRPQTVCPKPQLQQNWNHCYTEERRSNLPRSGLGKCEEADERMGKEGWWGRNPNGFLSEVSSQSQQILGTPIKDPFSILLNSIN